MAIHPDRPWCSLVCKETGVGNNGFVIVRGKQPKAKGRKNDLLILVQGEACYFYVAITMITQKARHKAI